MAQTSGRTCRNCGAPLVPAQRFCSNCGAVTEEGTSTPTTPSGESFSPVPDMSTVMSNIPTPPPPPPPDDGKPYTQYPETQRYAQEHQPSYAQVSQQSPPAYQPLPNYAAPQTTSAAPVLRRIGCGLGILLILLLALCGTVSYFVYNGIRNVANTPSHTLQNSGGGSQNGGNSTTPTTGPTTTTPINETITYASITISLLDVKQAQTFADDTSSGAQSGVLRLDIKEQNATSVQPAYYYSQILRLILPNQNSISPLASQTDVSPDASTTRTNWIDFAVPTTTNVAQTTLQFGNDTQAQMVVPLTGKADLSKYQAKMATVNKAAPYADLKWTIKTATRTWSNQGKQATKGMYYLVLDMSVDNSSSNDYSADWEAYIRMTAGNVTGPPDSSNIPITFNAGSSGSKATAAFLVPQSATSYTFVLLSEPSYPKTSQTTIGFQV